MLTTTHISLILILLLDKRSLPKYKITITWYFNFYNPIFLLTIKQTLFTTN